MFIFGLEKLPFDGFVKKKYLDWGVARFLTTPVIAYHIENIVREANKYLILVQGLGEIIKIKIPGKLLSCMERGWQFKHEQVCLLWLR